MLHLLARGGLKASIALGQPLRIKHCGPIWPSDVAKSLDRSGAEAMSIAAERSGLIAGDPAKQWAARRLAGLDSCHALGSLYEAGVYAIGQQSCSLATCMIGMGTFRGVRCFFDHSVLKGRLDLRSGMRLTALRLLYLLS